MKGHMLNSAFFSGYSRPTSLQDRGKDSDDEDFRDRDYDVAALASNLSQAFKYGIYSSEDIDEVSFF
jgi:serine/threonine-protein phosphatase 6 regulatory subunit 3